MSNVPTIAEIRQKARDERAAQRLNRKQAISRAAAQAGVSVYRLRGDYNRKKPINRKVRDPQSYHHHAEDTSPQWVRDLRLALTDKFIKTGELDDTILAKLKAYANEVHKTSRTSRTVDETTGFRPRGRRSHRSVEDTAGTRARPEEL